jgi:DNA-binding CsgD family transcriptional regulator
MWQGEITSALAQFAAVITEGEAAHDMISVVIGLTARGMSLAYRGDTDAARAAARAAIEGGADLARLYEGLAYGALAIAALAAGDPAVAREASDAAVRFTQPEIKTTYMSVGAQAALSSEDLQAARRWADEAVAGTAARPYYAMEALATRARVAIAYGEHDQAERDAHEALRRGADVRAYLGIPDILECLAGLAGHVGSQREAARLYGAAEAMRSRLGAVRFKIYDCDYEVTLAALREAMDDNDFEAAWAEGAGLSADEAIAYAQRGRGERKRPATGWASLTPAELDVVRLVSKGLGNNDIATRLFVSPRTVQSHLTHVYNKLGVASRVQLAQEAARRI